MRVPRIEWSQFRFRKLRKLPVPELVSRRVREFGVEMRTNEVRSE